MDIATFQTFLAAAATGSFAGAAQRVSASPSSVTERIKQLEHQLGATLFIRNKRGCQLTSAGERFVFSAQRAVRAWEAARHEVLLPERFQRSISFGGQYLLWDRLLLRWLTSVRREMPDLALRATAGAWARLNRELAEGELDLVVVHDPVFHRDISAQRLFEDRLILVTAGDPAKWEEDFVTIEWGRSIGLEIASILGVKPSAGLALDLGQRSADWLIANHMAGYMPAHLVAPMIENGALRTVENTPSFEFPAYVCWRETVDPELAAEIITSLRNAVPPVPVPGTAIR